MSSRILLVVLPENSNVLKHDSIEGLLLSIIFFGPKIYVSFSSNIKIETNVLFRHLEKQLDITEAR